MTNALARLLSRRGAAACILAALLTAVAVRATGTRYQERRKQLEAEAEGIRKKLGLDHDRVRLFAQYPTPEVQFGEQKLQLAPGATGTVRVTGSFPKGSVFLFSSDEVAIVKETQQSGSWEAQVKLAPTALPGEVQLHVTAPVSLAESAGSVLSIRGRYALEVTFEDGASAAFKPEQLEEGTLLGTVSFKAPGEKAASRTRRATLTGGDTVNVEVLPNDEDLKLQTEAMQAAYALLQDPDYLKKQEALGKKLEGCTKLPPATLTPCMQKIGEEMQGLQAKMTTKAEAIKADYAKKGPKGALNCSKWSLDGVGGKVSGLASCLDAPELKVTGTIRAVL